MKPEPGLGGTQEQNCGSLSPVLRPAVNQRPIQRRPMPSSPLLPHPTSTLHVARISIPWLSLPFPVFLITFQVFERTSWANCRWTVSFDESIIIFQNLSPLAHRSGVKKKVDGALSECWQPGLISDPCLFPALWQLTEHPSTWDLGFKEAPNKNNTSLCCLEFDQLRVETKS